MLSALIFAISLAALAQFAVYYWRALMLGTASQTVSASVCQAARLAHSEPAASDFDTLVELDALCPDLSPAGRNTTLVRIYYSALSGLSAAGRVFSSSLNAWASREMAACARYVAVRTSQRLERNALCYAAIRSY